MRGEQKKNPRNKIWKLQTLQIWTPLPIGATGIVASMYWRSAGIPILNSSADFLSPLCRFAYSAGHYLLICFAGAETEIDKIKDDGKIERETNLDRRGPSQIGTV
jgi:hypothetical protein